MIDVSLTCTIASGDSLSSVALSPSTPYIGLSGLTIYGIIMPSGWTAADLTMQISNESPSSGFNNVYDSTGSEVTITAAASRMIIVPPLSYISGKFIKLRSGTSGTPVNQGADRVITVLCRYFA